MVPQLEIKSPYDTRCPNSFPPKLRGDTMLKHQQYLYGSNLSSFILQLPANSSADFETTSIASSFQDGQTESSCNVFVTDDDIPEGNETFPVSITIRSGGAEVGSPSTTLVTILPSDDPYGAIGFKIPADKKVVKEPEGDSPITVQFELERKGGTVGDVSIFWHVRRFFVLK